MELYLCEKLSTNDCLHNVRMINQLNEVRFINEHPEEGEVLRKNHVQNIIAYAKEHTKFYSQVKGSELSDFPVISKPIIRENYADFLVPRHQIPGQIGALHIQHTSGSTGIPFFVPQDTCCRLRRLAGIKYGNERIGFQSFEPLAHIRSLKQYYVDKNEDIVHDHKSNITYFDNSCLDDLKMSRIVNEINKCKIRFVRGYMTSLDLITSYCKRNKIELTSQPFFISVGESLPEYLRLRIIDNLRCSIISQYGNEENGILGQTEINGSGTRIILNRASCFIELLKMDEDTPVSKGELGRIVVTDFSNYALPFIRYDTGDIAAIGEIKDNVLYSIDKLIGRRTDLVYKTNGELIDFVNSMPPAINNNLDVLQWQFIQHAAKTYTLKLLLRNDNLRKKAAYYTSLLENILGLDADIKIDFVDGIPILSSGKRRLVICEYKNS